MTRKKTTGFVLGLIATMFFGCASAPQTREDRSALEARADATVQSMVASDPSLGDVLARSAGYAVFPEIAEGGFVVGGAGGVGVVYERGRPIGYSELRAGTVGAQIGGQSYSEIIVFENRGALDRFRAGNFDLQAGLSATAVQSGAAARAQFENGVAVFVGGESGLMAAANVGGQSLNFTAK